MISAWLVGLLGVWMVIAPFTRMPPYGNLANNWLVGIVAAIVAYDIPTGTRLWQRPLAVSVGAWLFVSGFVPALTTGPGSFTNDMIVGVLLMAASFSALGGTNRMAPPPAMPR